MRTVVLLSCCLGPLVLGVDGDADEFAALGTEICPFAQERAAMFAVSHNIVDVCDLLLCFGFRLRQWRCRLLAVGCRHRRYCRWTVVHRGGLVLSGDVAIVVEGYFEFLVSHLNLNGFKALRADEMTLKVLDFFD